MPHVIGHQQGFQTVLTPEQKAAFELARQQRGQRPQADPLASTLPPLPPGTIGEFGSGGRGIPVTTNQPSGLDQNQIIPPDFSTQGTGLLIRPEDRFMDPAFTNAPTTAPPPAPPGTPGGLPMELIQGIQNVGPDRARKFLTALQDDPQGLRDFLTGVQTDPVGFQNALAGGPPTGLIGSEEALGVGLETGLDALIESIDVGRGDITGGKETAIDFLQGGRDLATEAITEGKEAFDPFFSTGVDANKLKADLSGANGPEAQARAFREFQESPGQEFLRSRGTKAIERAAGRFGDFGPNLFKDLASFEQGLALQDLQRQTGELGELAQRGFGAAQGLGQLAQTQAGIETDFGRSAAQAELGSATQLAQIAGTGGVNVANLIQQAARDIASGRFEAGKLIAQDIRNTVSTVGGLQEEQGRQLSNLLGAGASAVTQILQSSGLAAAEQQQVMAIVLANLTTGSASGQATFGANIANANALGELGQSQAVSATLERIFTALSEGTGGGGGGATISGSAGQLVA